ncbi:MAG: hypothetical protein N2053_12310, partial [Chitinispirillaceae bacterium]|nr:hypothetical protein [Chitinispirillaceae bacterium]
MSKRIEKGKNFQNRKRCEELLFKKSVLFFFLLTHATLLVFLFISCGTIEPSTPMGVAVWADDGSEIACAINRSDFDGRLFMNHEVNMRYDIAHFDT